MTDDDRLRGRPAGEPAVRRVALVTGASAGIGRETALAFARRGWAVALAARRVDRLETLAEQIRGEGGQALVTPADVADRSQVDTMVAQSVDRLGRLDALVNNAGYGLFGQVEDLEEAELRRIFDVNVFGVWYGMMAAIPIMLRQGEGHIFNVSSVIGKRGTPYHGAYCATKFAVCGLTESARVELRPRNIRVTLVCPSLTETEFFDKGSMARRANHSFKRFSRPMPAEPVGRAIARTAGRDRTQLVFTLGGKFLAAMAALLPRATDSMMELYRRELAKAVGGKS